MNEQKNIYVRFIKHISEKHENVYALLDALSNSEREKERGSYYKTISGLFSHSLNAMLFFKKLFEPALADGSKAKAALKAIGDISIKNSFTEQEWKQLKQTSDKICACYVDFADALTNEELACPVKVPFWGGKPESAPLSFIIEEVLVHTVHHFGQISQILDEIKIDNNYSAISVGLLNG
jgi:uncharacterized damage-inducible protein DinB